MLTTRSLAAALCALSLTIPAAASAKVADDGPVTPAVKGHVATGDTKGDLIAPTSGNGYVDKVGSLSPEQLAAAYGTARPKVTPVATPASSKSPDNGTDEWRVAAVVEAALLAAFAVGAALALSGRQRRRTAGLGV